MTVRIADSVIMVEPDPGIRYLIRLSAVIAAGSEGEIRNAVQECHGLTDPEQVEEVILQSYLFCGFPRALNAAREWRRISQREAPATDSDSSGPVEFRTRGEETCARVYGDAYEKLRENVRALHPALDTWMIEEGYGRVLSRPGLSLRVRELCIVAACAAGRQERQLHSHLHGALNAGATLQEVDGAIDSISGLLDSSWVARCRALWTKVKQSRSE